jgi:hypothetical protein
MAMQATVLGQWTRLGGPTPPPVANFVEHNGLLFAGTNYNDQGDIFVSHDQGHTWSDLGKPNGGVSDLLSHDGTLFLAGYFSGVHRSLDNGLTWTPVNGSMGQSVTVEKILPLDDQTMLAGLDQFFPVPLRRSEDGGWTWTEIATGPSLRCFDLVAMDGVILAGGEDSGVWRSTDGGVSWDQANQGLPEGTDAHAFESREGLLLVAAETVSVGLAVYQSSDLGQTWSQLSADLPAVSPTFIHQLEYIGNDLYLTINNTAGPRGVYRSTNNGVNWTALSPGIPGDLSAQAVIKVGADLLVGTLDGIFRSADNGQSWQPSWQGASGICGGQTAIWQDGRLVAGNELGSLTSGGLQYTTNLGQTWTPATGPVSQSTVQAFLEHGDALYAALYGLSRGVSVSLDGGQSFAPVGAGMHSGVVLNCLLAGTDAMLAGAFDGLWRSFDEGQSWNLDATIGPVNALAAHDGWIYAGLYPGGVMRSQDDGATWVEASAGLEGTIRVNGFAVFQGALFAALNGQGLVRWDGTTWESFPFVDNFPYDLQVAGDVLLASTSSDGIWYSLDGQEWGAFSQSQNLGIIEGLAVTPTHAVAITRSRGFWVRPLSELPTVAGVDDLPLQPAGLSLGVTPNPFNPQTTISFEMPTDSEVTLSVFDARGRLIRHLLEGYLAQGPQEVSWDGRDEVGNTVAAGVYLVRAVTPRHRSTAKLALVR